MNDEIPQAARTTSRIMPRLGAIASCLVFAIALVVIGMQFNARLPTWAWATAYALASVVVVINLLIAASAHGNRLHAAAEASWRASSLNREIQPPERGARNVHHKTRFSPAMLSFSAIMGVLFVFVGCFLVQARIFGVPEKSNEFGDSFGSVNALFTGLAFALLIVAVALQRRELEYQRRELELQREVQAETRAEMRRSADAQEETERVLLLSAYAAISELHYQVRREGTSSTTLAYFAGNPDAQKSHNDMVRGIASLRQALHAEIALKFPILKLPIVGSDMYLLRLLVDLRMELRQLTSELPGLPANPLDVSARPIVQERRELCARADKRFERFVAGVDLVRQQWPETFGDFMRKTFEQWSSARALGAFNGSGDAEKHLGAIDTLLDKAIETFFPAPTQGEVAQS